MKEKMDFDRKFTWMEVYRLIGHAIKLTLDLFQTVFDHDEKRKVDLLRKLLKVLFLPHFVLPEIKENSKITSTPFSNKTRLRLYELLLDKSVDTRSLSDSELLAEIAVQLVDY